jgi:hypothetical protein
MFLLKVRGWDRMRGNLKDFRDKFPERMAEAQLEEARIELKEAKRRTPVDTGDLRRSGAIAQTIKKTRAGTMVSTDIFFDMPYAIFVHEDLEANHPNGGQAKFLESVLNESAPHMAERLARRLRI